MSLIEAVKSNNILAVHRLIIKGKDINEVDEKGNTPLRYAVEGNNLPMVEILLNNHADPNQANINGATPTYMASKLDKLPILKKLIEYNADINYSNTGGYSPLHIASQFGNLAIIKELIRNGANIEAIDDEGYTPLHIASHYGNLIIIKDLIKNGANIDATDDEGYTPLAIAKFEHHPLIVRELLDSGAIDYTMDQETKIRLKELSLQSEGDLVNPLNGTTNLMYEVDQNNIGRVRQYIDEEVNLNHQSDEGNIALHYAIYNGNNKMVRLLTKYGSDTQLRNKDGNSSYTLARKLNRNDIISILKDYSRGIDFPPSLFDQIELYVWDYDCTINNGTNVSKLTDRELTTQLNDVIGDLPLFRNVILRLIDLGKKVGIASYGSTGNIFKPLNKIFEHTHNPFNIFNVITPQVVSDEYDIDWPDGTFPPDDYNKKDMMNILINRYHLDRSFPSNDKLDKNQAVLIDDNFTNILEVTKDGYLGIYIPPLSCKGFNRNLMKGLEKLVDPTIDDEEFIDIWEQYLQKKVYLNK